MKLNTIVRIGFIPLILLTFSCRKDPGDAFSKELPASKKSGHHVQATFKVFSTGFNNPRGLKFGPDGALYVAEGGVGGSNSSSGCEQVLPPVGPYTGSTTGSRISRVDATGERSTYVDNLPSSQTGPLLGNLVSGVADIAFVGNTMYALLAGAGCSHGVPEIPNGVIKIKHNKTWKMIADLSHWQQNHPVKNPEEDDFEPDGSWYSMISVRGDLYALEPNHGELVKIDLGRDNDGWRENERGRKGEGYISRVIDISASQGHIVPTAIVYDGNFYVGNLRTFPIIEGSSNIYKITPGGQIKIWATGFTTVLGLALDKKGNLYVLENTTGNPMPTPGTGKIIRVSRNGDKQTILEGLSLPTGMTFGPDGKLYVSNLGFGPPPIGLGQILQVDISGCGDDEEQ